jgi:hypothetical protein
MIVIFRKTEVNCKCGATQRQRAYLHQENNLLRVTENISTSFTGSFTDSEEKVKVKQRPPNQKQVLYSRLKRGMQHVIAEPIRHQLEGLFRTNAPVRDNGASLTKHSIQCQIRTKSRVISVDVLV